jgi:hypothetical protein
MAWAADARDWPSVGVAAEQVPRGEVMRLKVGHGPAHGTRCVIRCGLRPFRQGGERISRDRLDRDEWG